MRSIPWMAVVVTAVVGALVYEQTHETPAPPPPRPEPVLDQAATRLPEGIHDRWISALDRAINLHVSAYRQWLVFRPNSTWGINAVYYLPLSGLTFSCQTEPFEVRLEAGGTTRDRNGDIETGFTATLVPNRWGTEDEAEKLNLGGVGPQSPAALALRDELCQRLAERIDTAVNTAKFLGIAQ